MKRCPVCQSTYADDSLRFCLQDGSPLESAHAGASSDDFKTLVLPENAVGSSELPPTELYDPGVDVTGGVRPSPPTAPQRQRETNPITQQPIDGQQKPRSTAAIVGMTMAATIALLALGGLTAWLLLGDRKDNGARNINNGSENVNIARGTDNQNNTTPNTNTRPTPNANGAYSPSPTPTPLPTPTATPQINTSAEESEVRSALGAWLSSFRARDLDAYMAQYADVLEAYYLARNVSIARVRGDKARAFAKYSSIEVWLSNIQVRVDASGRRAVATFNKSWRFTAPGLNPYTGSGLNRFTFTKIGGRWLITGEEDLSR
ncbi:MAG: nuclear transport factor 2 family protein [Pyrinomonadaceae bacterium]|nr:nuclear transport factor 2 family protein [Pyrinomonadaceae bacterium]